jgi:hypothetical protein
MIEKYENCLVAEKAYKIKTTHLAYLSHIEFFIIHENKIQLKENRKEKKRYIYIQMKGN